MTNTYWRSENTLGGRFLNDVFSDFKAAEKWADDLACVYGFDYEAGDRQNITRLTRAESAAMDRALGR